MPVSFMIHRALRAQIVDMQLRPGASLNRQQIADHYRVSQSPVRDAFLRLESEGLIDIFPQSRTLVAPIDIDQARETQFLRLGLELEVCRSLARRGDAGALAEARNISALQKVALEQNDLSRFSRLDWEFHHALYAAAGYPQLWDMISARSGHIDRLRQLNLPDPGKPAAVLDYHERILERIAAGDDAGCERAVREHLSGTLGAVEDIRDRHPEFF
ncbi:GntR family transcriptional regulator [Acidimangrovimonas sediminis]|uniref:GntR family transcriptional regulator n=1 Tax=Acidimangrovimonas sediminis TaxID=2056283 RepID=UPI001E601EC8|nr:GntR family transcriptional regulator [Acidimangrovimonas sediminis]